MKELFPNLIVGGAPKCGTSSLYFWLCAHPEVFGSPKKETSFYADKVNKFNKSANVHEHKEEDYLKYFKGSAGAKIRFEATAHYLYEETALKTFSEAPNPPKTIFLFREPSKQMYSHYKMEKFRTKTKNLPLHEYMRLPSIAKLSDYANYLKKWVHHMPEGSVRIWAFEDLMTNKVQVMKEIAEYLGIDPDFYDHYSFEHRNESVVIKSGFLHQLGLKLQPLVPHGLQKILLPVYMLINSGGRAPDNESDLPALAEFKAEYAHVGGELKALFPEFHLESWK